MTLPRSDLTCFDIARLGTLYLAMRIKADILRDHRNPDKLVTLSPRSERLVFACRDTPVPNCAS